MAKPETNGEAKGIGDSVDLTTRIGSVIFKNPVLVASGTFGYGAEAKAYCDINGLGGVVTKSVSWKPRVGNHPHRIVEMASGMLNSIGLANVGVHVFVKEKLPYLAEFDTKIIANIAASSVDEYRDVLEMIEQHATPNLAGYEINVSCPNVKDGGLSFGTNVDRTAELTATLRDSTKRLLIIKLTPNVTSVAPFAQAVEEAGADAISLINTVVGMAVDHKTRRPRLSTVTGGLSGPAVKPIALAKVYEARKSCTLPIIGIGGIMNGIDAAEFMIVGATMVQVGTANFVNPHASLDCVQGIEEYLREQNLASVSELVGSLKVEATLKAQGW